MQTVIAVRHGETDWNRVGRLQGWAPVDLSERGRSQTLDLARSFPGPWTIDRFVSSDLARARETAERLARTTQLPSPTFHRAFRERDLGRYQGLTGEALRQVSGCETRDVDFVPPGGESLRTMADRVRTGLRSQLETLSADGTLLLVTHGGPIRTLLGLAHNQELQVALDTHDPENCSVQCLGFQEGDLQSATLLDVPSGLETFDP